MRGFLRALAAEGRAVLVSSHLMSELEDTADHLVVIGRGKLVADTSVAELIAAASAGRVTLRTSARAEAMAALANAGATVAATGPDTLTVTGSSPSGSSSFSAGDGCRSPRWPVHRSSLEEAYMELTRDAVEFRAARDGGRRPMSATATPYRSSLAAGPDGFAQVLRAEWTKFRTVRGWVITALASALLIVCSPTSARSAIRTVAICVGPNPRPGTVSRASLTRRPRSGRAATR